MPAFIRIGPHPSPKQGQTARGWAAYRRGSQVLVFWGPIEILQLSLGRTKYVWFRRARLPRRKLYSCRSEQAARRKYKELSKRKMTRSADHNGYVKLPSGSRIRFRKPSSR
jgi:hypothetical protein